MPVGKPPAPRDAERFVRGDQRRVHIAKRVGDPAPSLVPRSDPIEALYSDIGVAARNHPKLDAI